MEDDIREVHEKTTEDDTGSDADFGNYFEEVLNGQGYYDEDGKFHWFGGHD